MAGSTKPITSYFHISSLKSWTVSLRTCTLKKTFFQKKRLRFPLFGFALSSVPFLAIVVLLNFNFSICLWIEWDPNIQMHNSPALLPRGIVRSFTINVLVTCTTLDNQNGCLVRERFQGSSSWRDRTKWCHQSLHWRRRRIHRLSHREEINGRGMYC